MRKELIIVDDDADYLETLAEVASMVGLEPRTFDRPSRALGYLQQAAEAPLGYMIDMKPYPRIPEGFSPDKYPEAAVPEQIFWFLKKKRWLSNFYFITGHLSEHDEEVLERTEADCLDKSQTPRSILEAMVRAGSK